MCPPLLVYAVGERSHGTARPLLAETLNHERSDARLAGSPRGSGADPAVQACRRRDAVIDEQQSEQAPWPPGCSCIRIEGTHEQGRAELADLK